MEFNRYIRKPFVVEAVEITEENMEAVAALIGEVRRKGDTLFISLNRRIVPNVNRAYVGWFMTRMVDNYRCYSPKVFHEQFAEFSTTQVFTFDPAVNYDEEDDGRIILKTE